jgi:putative MATE family efflux protein
VTVLALLLVKPLLFVLRVDEAAYHEAWVYMMIVCAGLAGTIGYNTNAGILNGIGNSRTTLLFLAVSAVLNIVLDLTLVLSVGMGVAGVALGTIVSQTFSWLFGLFYINRKYPQIAIHPFCFRFDRVLFQKVLGIGLPAGLQMALVSLGMMAVMSKINTFGKIYTAAYNVGNKMDNMAFLVVQALTNSITAFVGQNTGAKKPERVRTGIRITVTATVVWCLVMTAVLLPASDALFHLFSPEAAVAKAGGYYIRSIMPPYVLFGIMFVLNGAMRGAGESVFPMVATILSMIVLRVPAVYYLANRFGPEWMFYGFGIGWVGGFILCAVYYFSGRWKRRGSLAEETS